MDLKEMVLSTLADLQNAQEAKLASEPIVSADPPTSAPTEAINATQERQETIAPKQAESKQESAIGLKEIESDSQSPKIESQDAARADDEAKFLSAVKERVLTLFEGFQSPNNRAVEAKVDLTLNFLEYLLSAIEERLDELTPK
ncbi:MAG: hypothetical protein LBF86_01375 [Helicobacteraceae bacterium]|nr:hypothetical protein [Helicobacteraceae bacterium]